MAAEDGHARTQEAVQVAAEEASRREREVADRRVIAAEKDVLLQSQMCALPSAPPCSYIPSQDTYIHCAKRPQYAQKHHHCFRVGNHDVYH